MRRFYCRNPACRRRTFAERVPALLATSARRTRRLAAAQCAVGVTVGAEAGARLAARLAMRTSADTLLRLVRRVPLLARETPRVLGVDDWALKKGRTYGTLLVDLDARRVVDLLPDRTAATLAAWLRRRRGIEIIARDRSAEYARAAVAGAPEAQQVADRWHLLLNTRQMIERWLTGAHGRLRHLPPVPSDAPAPTRRAGAFPRTRADAAASADGRARRLVVYEQVRRRHRAGEPLLAISRMLGLARGTVRKYASAETFPERDAHPPRPSLLDPFLPHLTARHGAGCENATMLWREVRALGYQGTARQVHRWLQSQRTAPARTTPRAYCGRGSAPHAARAGALPPPKQLAWVLVQPPAARSPAEAATVARVAQDADAARVVALAQRFAALVRDRAGDAAATLAAFDTWLADALACGVRAVATFAVGLHQDGAAVRAALTTPWSNAQAEGHITRLKLLKRQMYGRANFDLLRRRVLLAA